MDVKRLTVSGLSLDEKVPVYLLLLLPKKNWACFVVADVSFLLVIPCLKLNLDEHKSKKFLVYDAM